MSISEKRKKRAVAIWLLVGVFMIIVQIVLGGIVRLTDSGLSMTQWNPIMGAIPPLNHDQWMAAFKGYQEIAQFKYVNSHFSLSDFKFIFFWEWFHRLWARSLGVVFAIPFIYFLIKKYFSKDMIVPLLILFVLGGLQGFIGWYMVQSGLYGSSLLRVSHIRLSIHFIAALVLLCYAFWFALKLLVPKEKRIPKKSLRRYTLSILIILIIQLFYGAFMAGLRAALYAPTWPKINQNWVSHKLFTNSWFSDAINVHFIHRTLAYLLVILILIAAYKLWKFSRNKANKLLQNTGAWAGIFIVIQLLLGIFTVLSVAHIRKGKFGLYETLAEAHQLNAIFLLMALVMLYYLLSPSKKEIT